MKKYINNILDFIKENSFIIVIILLILSIASISFYNYLYKPYKVDRDFSKLDLDGVNKLMIVAHPDDEMLWGGAHLIEDDYLVVCITCGTVKERVNEFTKVMEETNDKYLLLGYPDKTNGERDNWDNYREDIKNNLKEIISLKDWEIIVTHNPDGEYGHIHHKMTNQMTTEVTDNKDKLYYFGHYYSKKNIVENYNHMTPINDIYMKRKRDILGLYISQDFIQTMFDHMFDYEDWIAYEDWEVLE